MALESIVNELYLPYSPEQVWRALTDSAALAQWLMPNTFEARVGHRFTFRTEPVPPYFDGIVNCEVKELDSPMRLAYSWTGGPLVDTLVNYTLRPQGAGTMLHFEHSGFDTAIPAVRFVKAGLSQGWLGPIFTERLIAAIEMGG